MERTVKLQIQGMHCESCAQVIEMELEEIPGFKSAAINFQTGAGAVVVAGEVDDVSIITATAKAGYKGRIAGQ